MNEVNKYKAFLESITDNENKELIEIITEGFDSIHSDGETSELKEFDSVDVRGMLIQQLLKLISKLDISYNKLHDSRNMHNELEGFIEGAMEDIITNHTLEGAKWMELGRNKDPREDDFYEDVIMKKTYPISNQLLNLFSEKELDGLMDKVNERYIELLSDKLTGGE